MWQNPKYPKKDKCRGGLVRRDINIHDFGWGNSYLGGGTSLRPLKKRFHMILRFFFFFEDFEGFERFEAILANFDHF